jgi:hypothetical protein
MRSTPWISLLAWQWVLLLCYVEFRMQTHNSGLWVLFLGKSQKLHEWHLGEMVAGAWLQCGSSPSLLYCKAGMMGAHCNGAGVGGFSVATVFWTYPCEMPVLFAHYSVTHWFDVMIVQTVAWFFVRFTLACHCTPCLVNLYIYIGFTRQTFKIIITIDCIETTISAVDLHGLLKKFVHSCCSYSDTVPGTGDTLPLRGWMVHTNMSQPKLNTLRTGDENSRHLRFLLNNCERQMTQICLLTRAWILRT